MSNSYSPAFQKAIAFILPHENEYARGHWGDPNFVVAENVAGDAGGVTKYGIDKASHPNVDVANLTEAQAVEIYHEEWLAHELDDLPEKLAVAAFDVWVNGGHAVAWLQLAYNAADSAGDKAFLAEDGIMGPATIEALDAVAGTPIEAEILADFLQERDERFKALAAAHPNDAQFLAGWLQRDADLRSYLSIES